MVTLPSAAADNETLVAEMIAAGGFTTQKVWTDPDRWFSVHFCTRD